MPRSLRGPVKLQLKADEGTDQLFLFRSLTMDDERTLGNNLDKHVETPDELHDSLAETLVPYLVGWKLKGSDGIEIDFDSTKLTEIINTAEARDLASQLLSAGHVSYTEKKSAESQQSSEEDFSANTALPESATSKPAGSSSSVPVVMASGADNASKPESSN